MGNIDSKNSKLNTYSTTDLNLIFQPYNFPFLDIDLHFCSIIFLV